MSASVTHLGGRSTDRLPELPYWPLQRSKSVASGAAPACRWTRKDLQTHAGPCHNVRGYPLCSKSLSSPDTVMARRHIVSVLGAIAMAHNWRSVSKAETSCGDDIKGCCDGIASGLPQRVAVIGADGRTGSEVVEALRRYGVEEVIGGVRQTSKAASVPALQLQGVKIAEIDLVQGTSSDIAGALDGCGAVICCAGFRPSYIPDKDRQMAEAIDNQGICKLVDAAVDADVGRFVLVSSLLTNAPRSDPSYRALNMLGGVLDAKHESELHLMASPLSYTIIRPGVFAAGRQGALRLVPADTIMSPSAALEESRNAGGSAAVSAKSSCVSPLAGGSSMGGRLCAVTRQQVAQVCVEALLVDPSKSCRKTVEMYADSLYDGRDGDGYGAAAGASPISGAGNDDICRRWEALP